MFYEGCFVHVVSNALRPDHNSNDLAASCCPNTILADAFSSYGASRSNILDAQWLLLTAGICNHGAAQAMIPAYVRGVAG